jgi:putative copper export protein
MRETMLIIHFIGLSMGLGTSFAHAFLNGLISKMEKEQATKFRLQLMVLSKMGYTGLVLLIISGSYLIMPFWPSLPSNPLLIIKLALVVLLACLLFLINRGYQKALISEPEKNLKKIEPFGKLTLLVSVAIVIIAVSIFH